jgi:hypothetical protein
MSENVIEELFIPVGSGLPLSEMELSGPNITGILEAFPASDQFDGGDFLPETTYSLPNHLFTSDLLQELGLTDVKSYFALESTEYEGKLANYMRGQILYSFVSLGDRSLSRRKDMGTNYTNYAGDSPFQTSQARFYNYDDVQTGSSNTVLVILIIGLILLAGVFAFLAFYPRGSRLSRFA